MTETLFVLLLGMPAGLLAGALLLEAFVLRENAREQEPAVLWLMFCAVVAAGVVLLVEAGLYMWRGDGARLGEAMWVGGAGVAGALAASTGGMSIPLLWVVLVTAAILGDAVNYSIGRRIGTRVFSENARVLKTSYLRRTEAFYEKHGNRTIIMARFVPIVRTFAPFVAGVGSMQYRRFATYNVVGGLAWVTIFLGAGALFGQIPFVKENFEIVTLGIVLVSVLPIVFEFVKERRRSTESLPRA